jgi:hypothetical protein
MKQGCWVVVALAFLASSGSFAGFDIGNGGFEIGNGFNSMLSSSKGTLLTDLYTSDFQASEEGRAAELFAPLSDESYPRTKISLRIVPLPMDAKAALEHLIKTGRGWVAFATLQLTGARRELLLSKKTNVSRFEVQLIREDEKLIISVEGNKETSKVYEALHSSLLAEIVE